MKYFTIFILSMMLFTTIFAQKITFSVNEIGEGSCYVIFDLTNNQVTATKSNGKTLFSHHIGQKKYDQILDVIGFSFSDNTAPVMKYNEHSDLVIISNKNYNIKYQKNNTPFLFKAQNNSSFSSSFLNLLSTIDGYKSNRTFTVNGVSFKMIYVQGGTFTMGATPEQGGDAESDERPAHGVTLSSYYIGETEVTQELWQAVMGSNPSYYKENNKPVECVSFNDCVDFISKLNAKTGQNFRLPTEAEWEYGARGGNKSKGYKYSGSDNLDNVAWFDGNGKTQTHDVATKKANELGIYDMSGNVWEWCSDSYGKFSSDSQTNQHKSDSDSYRRISRGGSWYNINRYCRVANRYSIVPTYRSYNQGLRLAL